MKRPPDPPLYTGSHGEAWKIEADTGSPEWLTGAFVGHWLVRSEESCFEWTFIRCIDLNWEHPDMPVDFFGNRITPAALKPVPEASFQVDCFPTLTRGERTAIAPVPSITSYAGPAVNREAMEQGLEALMLAIVDGRTAPCACHMESWIEVAEGVLEAATTTPNLEET